MGIRSVATNALRYNTNKGVWREYSQPFDAALLKAGRKPLTLTVPAGELTSGVVYDYLRLELNEDAKPGSALNADQVGPLPGIHLRATAPAF